MPDAKQFVFLFDGTGNTPDQEDEGFKAPTNVKKFKDAIAYQGGYPQAYYYDGVGTRCTEIISGMAWGEGIADRLQEAFRDITHALNDLQNGEDYQIYILGFSRGAYTARVFSWLLTRANIPHSAAECEARYNLFESHQYNALDALDKAVPNLEITMLGIWDTVKTANYNDYNDTELSSIVNAGYHAMAIDEKRGKFPVLKWIENDRTTQVWFPGVHSDVGGGYYQSGLSDISLEWMFYNAIDHDLQIRGDLPYHPKPKGYLHNSYKGIWKLPGFGGTADRPVLPDEEQHPSVAERLAGGNYTPNNLP